MIREQVAEVVTGLADTVLRFEIRPCGEPPQARPHSLAAHVQVTGGWNGLIGVEFPPALARRVARVMLALKREPVDEEVADALGEVANIIGGNLKALLPGPSRLSLPQVDADGSASWLDSGSERVTFQSGDELFTVVVQQAHAAASVQSGQP